MRARYLTRAVVVAYHPLAFWSHVSCDAEGGRWPTWPRRAFLVSHGTRLERRLRRAARNLDPDAGSRSRARSRKCILRHPARVPDRARSPGRVTERVLRDTRRRVLRDRCLYAGGVPARRAAG